MTGPNTVLVVDDQAPFRFAAKAVLRRLDGFELVGEAASGAEGIALVDELHPDLVLMDINMPGMNGIEAGRQIVAGQPAGALGGGPGARGSPPPGEPAGRGPGRRSGQDTSGTEPLTTAPCPGDESQR